MNIKISEIIAHQTYPLRHSLLRKGKPLSSCQFEKDKSLETIHLGAFDSEKLIGIISAFLMNCPDYPKKTGVQLRALAVEYKYQRIGIASKLINQIISDIQKKLNPDCIWLNARIAANELYKLNGFNYLGSPFEINGIGMHQRFIKFFSK